MKKWSLPEKATAIIADGNAWDTFGDGNKQEATLVAVFPTDIFPFKTLVKNKGKGADIMQAYRYFESDLKCPWEDESEPRYYIDITLMVKGLHVINKVTGRHCMIESWEEETDSCNTSAVTILGDNYSLGQLADNFIWADGSAITAETFCQAK